MPTYIYKCPITDKGKEWNLPMGHDFPTYSDLVEAKLITEEKCKEIGVSLDDKLQRVYTAAAISWGGVRGSTGRPTESTSENKKKTE